MPDQSTKTPALSRRAFLGLAVLGTGLAAFSFQFAGGLQFEGAALTVEEAHEKAAAGDIILIDIRRPDEWKRTGIGAGAHPIDMRRDDFVDALTEVAGDSRSQPIALICARGVRSARLSTQLTEAGFTQIIDVPEGMQGSAAGPGWLSRKLPTYDYEDPTG